MIVFILNLLFLFLFPLTLSVHTDASGLGISAALSVARARQEHSMVYYSKKLNATTVPQSLRDLVISSIQYFCIYLYYVHWIVGTDQCFHRSCLLQNYNMVA